MNTQIHEPNAKTEARPLEEGNPPKGFDALLLAAFQAGLTHGSRLTAPHPRECCRKAYWSWRDHWAGLPLPTSSESTP